jgi:hypothetical protein
MGSAGGPPGGLAGGLSPSATLELWALTTLSADIDNGAGDVSATFGRAELNMSWPVGGTNPGNAQVVSLIVGSQVASYDFSTGALVPPSAPPANADAPWDTLFGIDVSASYRAPIDERWGYIVGAGIESSFEAGADFGDTLTFGAFGALTYAISPELVIGGGAFVSSRLEDDVRVIPAPFIRWRASERISVTSGAGTGPTGPGVSVFYAIDEAWTAGLSVGFRSIAARLDDEGVAPGGVGRHEAIPVVASITWKASETIELTALAGMVLGQEFEVLDSDGNRLVNEDADAAPAFAVLAKIVF